MKFYRALGEIQVRGNLLVREAVHQTGKNFFFPARQLDLAVNRFPSLQQLVRLLVETFQNLVLGLNHHHIISRRLASDHAVHCQEPSGLVQGKPPVRPGFNVKVRHSSVFFVEKEDIARKTWAGIHLLLWMLTSADHLHVHPPQNAAS